MLYWLQVMSKETAHLITTTAYLAIQDRQTIERALELGRSERERAMIILYVAGYSLRDLGKLFLISPQRISRIFQSIGIDGEKRLSTAIMLGRGQGRGLTT